LYVVGGVLLGTAFLIGEDYQNSPDGILSTMFNKKGMVKEFYESTFLDTLLPSSDELLPTWGSLPDYANVPPGTPAPPLLVLDVEKTLIASEHDPRYGWRHVKRPGAAKLIAQLSNIYEIVLITESDTATMEHVLISLDPEHRCHKMGSPQCELRGDDLLKRLDFMNRDMSRIILVDDCEKASQLFPRNTILVTPYEDVRDKNDTELLELIPVLAAMGTLDSMPDLRRTMDELGHGTRKAADLNVEYQMRVHNAKTTEEMKRNRGLGKILRQAAVTTPPPAAAKEPAKEKGSVLSQIMGSGAEGAELEDKALKKLQADMEKPVVVKKKGSLMSWVDRNEEERAEQQMRKMEEMNRLHHEKMMKKMQQQQQSRE
jgi:mitochondrial import inner membrane translocase subunit TIM50